MLDRTRWTPLARNGHAWAELRPTLPNQRPLLLIGAGTGLILMLWLFAQDTASSGGALMPFHGGL